MAEGGKVFWVAPSGGRDRPNEQDQFVVSPFDLKALDMFKMVALQVPHMTDHRRALFFISLPLMVAVLLTCSPRNLRTSTRWPCIPISSCLLPRP